MLANQDLFSKSKCPGIYIPLVMINVFLAATTTTAAVATKKNFGKPWLAPFRTTFLRLDYVCWVLSQEDCLNVMSGETKRRDLRCPLKKEGGIPIRRLVLEVNSEAKLRGAARPVSMDNGFGRIQSSICTSVIPSTSSPSYWSDRDPKGFGAIPTRHPLLPTLLPPAENP